MTRYSYDHNGEGLNRELDMSVFDEVLGEDSPTHGAQPMEISGVEALGRTAKIEKIYTMLARGVVSCMARQVLDKRQLASSLYVYTVNRNVRLESGIQSVRMPYDVVALNFTDLEELPEGMALHRSEHTLWIAQNLINYDFGVQHQERAKVNP